MTLPLVAWVPGPLEWTIIGVVAVIIFGRRLPEVGRSLGRSYVEFRKGLRGVQEDLDAAPPARPEPRDGEQPAGKGPSG